MTKILLKYHTVAPKRLVAATLRDLAASGIPDRALGRVSASLRVTLVGCAALNAHARSYLPAALGGTAAPSPEAASPGVHRSAHDVAMEQQSLAASIAMEGLKADVIAGLLSHRMKFPLVAKAMLSRGAGAGLQAASLGDLPILALLPALHAARLQEHGLELLADSAVQGGGGNSRTRGAR